MKKIFICIVCISFVLNASEINLKTILKNIQNTSNKIKLLKEDLKIIKINQNQNDSLNSSTVYLDAKFGRKKFMGKNINDSFAYIVFKKNIYNEKSDILNEDYLFNQDIKNILIQNEIQNEKINYMKAYFDVIISDMYYEYQLENIVPIFGNNSRAIDNNKIGRSSDIEVFKSNSVLLMAQANMFEAKQNMDITRSILANMININEYNLSKIEKPNIKFYWKKEKLDLEKLKALMYKNNIYLKVLNLQKSELNNKINRLSKNKNINVSLNSKIGSEPRITKQNDDIRWEASINMKLPLYDVSKDSFTIKRMIIEKNKINLQILSLKQKLNKELLYLVSSIQKNIRIKKALYSKFDYADLNSEKSRALFEINRKSDLGNSLTLETKVLYEFRKNEYEYVINFEKLNLLIGDKNEIY